MPDPELHSCEHAYHVSVVIYQDGRPLGYRVLDIRTEHPVLMKELACRVMAAQPALAGAPWGPKLRLDGEGASSPHLTLEAHLADADGQPKCGEPLAITKVPIASFSPIAARLAAVLQVAGRYEYSLAVHEPDSPTVAEWNAAQRRDEGLEWISGFEPELMLPGGFSATRLPEPRRVMDRAGTWLRCVFRKPPLKEFLEAAARETCRERSWLGLGDVHLSQDACSVVIEDSLVELPGEAGHGWITTRGRDWAKSYSRFGSRLVAFLHLHPRMLNDQRITPEPSMDDTVVAWNVELACPRPVVFPIAMFGTDERFPDGDVAAYGHEGGLLTRIQLEVE
jgi:hypothetical protein